MHDLFVQTDPKRLLPLFWLRGEAEEALREGVRQVKASGCGALCAESRIHPNFLGDRWWHDIGILLDECEKLDMKLWILDDMLFPSGYAAGQAAGTQTCRMMMTERHMDIRGPVLSGSIMVMDDERKNSPGAGLVAVVAARRLEETDRQDAFEDIGGFKLGQTIDITHTVKDGMAYWDVPEGIWRIFVMTSSYVSERTPPRYFANPLMPEGGRLMIDVVYQPHYDHFGKHFGKTLAGFFSDEPALRAGRGHRAILGEYPRLPIAWCKDMPDLLMKALGTDAVALLPGIWYDIGRDTPRVRHAVMDVLSRLYGENYSMQIGDWCRSHGVEYIGHVIEQNNSHARLGSGAGHFFRAISGQDMAGIDIVLHEVRPELRGTTHAWQSQDFEADDDFFRYMLAQMAVSSAYIDPKKKGRTMCEIFGAYGWQEDVAEMRYLVNLTLSRGVNYYSPHAFSLKPYPDPDSPPHFDGLRHPLMPYISRLFGYMARVGTMIEGGKPICRTAVLYFAEGEWANGQAGSMKTQQVVKALNEWQMECLIVPIDLLEQAEFDLLFIPWAKRWPHKLLDSCQRLKQYGKTVCFVNAMPEGLSDGAGEMTALTAGLEVVPLEDVAGKALAAAPLPYEAISHETSVHVYPYERMGEKIFLLFNEDIEREVIFSLQVQDRRHAYVLDREQEDCYHAKTAQQGDGQIVTVTLDPGQLLCIVFTDRNLPCTPPKYLLRKAEAISLKWNISIKAAGEAAFTHLRTTDVLFNITAADCRPRFCGTVRYEADIELPANCVGIDLGKCGNAARLWLDGQEVGIRIAPPYSFAFQKPAGGRHHLCVEVANSPVFAHRDPLSFFAYIKPTGILGPVMACTKAGD